MLRIAVATYLMVVTLAGPWLCCCTITRQTALFSAHVSGKWTPHPAKHTDHSCCGHAQATPSPCRTADEAGPRKHVPQDRPGCPCKPGSSVELAPPADSRAAQQALQLNLGSELVETLTGLLVPYCPSSGQGRIVGRQVDLPFLTADDVLHSLHILRC